MDVSIRVQELHSISCLLQPTTCGGRMLIVVFVSQHIIQCSVPTIFHDDTVAWSLAAYAHV